MSNLKGLPSISAIQPVTQSSTSRHYPSQWLQINVILTLLLCISSAEAEQGKVDSYDASAGYGYLTDNETKETFIFESADVTGNLKEGDSVSFTITTADDKFSVKAQSVVLTEQANPSDTQESPADSSAEDKEADDASDPADADDPADSDNADVDNPAEADDNSSD